MIDKQIVKSLEICSSEHLGCEDGCPYTMQACMGGDAILKDALDLINRQKAEIEKLENIERLATKTIEKLSAEIERLKAEIVDTNKIAKSEAINEFAEKLKNNMGKVPMSPSYVEMIINNVVKEMTE